MPEYSLEKAKTARSTCPGCKDKIAKDDVRMCVSSRGPGDIDMKKYWHVGCFKLPRKFASGANQLTVAEFLEEHVTSDAADEILPEMQEEIIANIEGAADKLASMKKRAKDDGDTTIMGQIKKAADGEESPKKKKRKTEGDDNADFDSLVKEYRVIANAKPKLSVDALKDYLRWNRQVLKGTKDFVTFKVLDGKINGRLGYCLLDGGKLKVDDDMENVCCNGEFDEGLQQRIPCSFRDHRLSEKVPRLKWFDEEPTEEEKEEMEKLAEAAKSGQASSGGSEDNPQLKELLEKAEELEWNVDAKNKKTISAGAKKLTALGKGIVAIPEGMRAKTEIANMILQNKGKTAKEMMQLVVDKYGLIEERAEKAEAKEEAIAAACKVPENAPLLGAMQELAKLYFGEGNRNAGGTYVKVANAIKDLNQQITSENAMSFSKGKTKIPGIGASTAKKMKEFMESGTIEKLEEKRALANGQS